MTIAIEQLIKMHNPRCMSIESLNVEHGQGILFKDQIVGAFASTQHHHSVGFDLLIAKYRHDSQAEQRIRAAIYNWVNTRTRLMHSDHACQLALSMVFERNLPAQIDHIAGLLRRYGAKAAQLRKNTDALRAEIKQLERQRCREKVSHADYISAGIEIIELNERISHERKALREWSVRQATQLNVCPRCNGTGKRYVQPLPCVMNVVATGILRRRLNICVNHLLP
ncbi:TIGR02642 family protein [Pectobacterium aroidearum]|uniref:TIGR02642 family protein n=1 Tax=Pectobacterium aroidearum TaxID=1201031 RepID=UPI003018B04F